MTAELQKRQSLLGVPKHDLIQDVPTRWNSSHSMIERLCEQRRVLNDIMLDEKITKKDHASLLLKDHEWDLLDQLSVFFKDFSEVTTFMSTESHVSLSHIYPIVCGLIRKNSIVNSDNPIIRKARESVISELQRRYSPTDEDIGKSILILASFLDPKYKALNFLSKEQKKVCMGEIESRMDDIPLRDSIPSSNDDSQPPAKRARKPSGIDYLTQFSPEKEKSTRENELENYLSDRIQPNEDPLLWWRKNEEKYPVLSKLAKKFLGVPATSVPPERFFSSAGLIITKLRNRLSSELVDKIIFLHKNKFT
ncbi:E3 SUMO-protein ligase ZBED1-like [Saccostrea echinata]|uniref:E3 SUMO-protein ligase ZBED1-like n=1 Tax=Saccostrea echinata TaxID=191078 RepID=UPI002A83EDD2|nr:E3 SUMO-protein ligase ZBED1-like [Saccostrea echinata]